LNMLVKKVKSVLVVAGAILMLTSLSYAKSYKIDVIYPATVGRSTRLHPGTYRVRLLSNSNPSRVAFFNRNGRRVASVPVTVKSETRKNRYTEVDYNKLAQNDHALTEIRPRGQSEALVFVAADKAMATGKKTAPEVKGKKSRS
jgi:hypothetical protein